MKSEAFKSPKCSSSPPVLRGAYVFPGGLDGIGGSESQALEFLRHYDKERFLVDLILIGPNQAFHSQASRISGLRTLSVSDRALSPWHPVVVRGLAKTLKEGQYDFVHLYGLRQEIVSRPLAKIFGKAKVISAIRGMESHRRRYHRWLNRMTGFWVDLWISNSRQTKDLFVQRDHLPSKKIMVIPNGVEVALQGPDHKEDVLNARKRMGLPESSFVVGCVANHLPAKRLEDLVSAALHVRNRGIDVQLVLIGRTGDYSRILSEKISALGLDPNVHILGYRNDVKSLITGFDVISLPSEKEGFPSSILEGMAAGLPSVVTPVAGLKDLVIDGETGFFVPLKSPESLAEKLTWLHDNPSRSVEMGRKGRALVEREYSVDILVERLQTAYQDLVSDNRND